MQLIEGDEATPGAPGVPGVPGVLLSASDLRTAAACEHALLAGLDVALGRRTRPLPVDDALLERVAELGDAHEQTLLRRLAREHPGGVRSLPRPPSTPEGYAAAHAQTLRLLADPAVHVVHQACLYDGASVGFADVLLRAPDGWVVADAKLARSESVAALLQVGTYAAMLADDGVALAPFVRLVLGDDEESDTALADVLPVVAARRARLAEVVTRHLADGLVADVHDDRVAACLRCETCTEQLVAEGDVLLVAGVHVGQRTALAEVGVGTLDSLADLPDGAVVPGLRPEQLDRLRAQARLQRRATEGGGLPWEVTGPAGVEALSALPAPSPGDVFFDFEGDPLWHEAGSTTWGLEYLFGALTHDEEGGDEGGDGGGAGGWSYRAFWAHDRREEAAALRDFLDWLQERRRRWPDLHVYHYAAYERSALLRLAARHGVGQEEVDGLLRDGVLVDLYATVRSAVRVGSDSYSIKRLEPLYVGEQRRDADGVTGGGDSVVEYHRWTQALVEGRADDAAARLEDIRQYNAYDCLSTLRLRDWLLDRAAGCGVTPAGPTARRDPDASVEEPPELETALRALVGEVPPHERTPEQQGVALLASAIGYYRREAKPYWWGHYDRLRLPVQEWPGGTDVFRVEHAEAVTPWQVREGRRTERRRVRLRGEFLGGTSVEPGSQMQAVYGHPAPAAVVRPDDAERGVRGAATTVDVLAVDVVLDARTGEERVELLLEEGARTGVSGWPELPVGLGPAPAPPARSIDAAIAAVAATVCEADADAAGSEAAGGERGAAALVVPEGPATDLLLRRTPRLVGGAALPQTGRPVDDIHDALLRLDRSYVAVQGPPGTGKTWVGAQVVTRLVRDHGWRVGVVAQSHAAVEHLLDEVVAAGLPGEQVGKALRAGDPRDAEDVAWTALSKAGYTPFAAGHAAEGRGCVLGGTAWDLTNPSRVEPGSLDLLVVEEAGQFALAPTIGYSVAASRLLLLGDPRQLPQVSQGTHPDPVDRSALGWLLDREPTMPEALGYFLPETWRMHPDLTEPVSRLAYAGRLSSREEVTRARSLDGVLPGLHVREVAHAGRTTESPEEAAEVAGIARDLVGRAWTDAGVTRALTADDLLVVTPYHHQAGAVRRALAAAGLPDVRVGTVDAFQGQQAPVVIVSMAASSAHDVSRGLGFLLSRHRLNVAISRGQHAAYVVMSPLLLDAVPRTPRELVTLGAFMGLVDAGHRTPSPTHTSTCTPT